VLHRGDPLDGLRADAAGRRIKVSVDALFE
jgi:hypothetical protein